MFDSREGQSVPNVTFKTRADHEWIDVSTTDIFADKTVVVFSLPGAFTPTCSSTHVPRYNQLADTFKQHGVDEIVCVSVNDAFVMGAWGQAQNAEEIIMLADGNGEFTSKVGLELDGSGFGLGTRSQRYAMIVENGAVTHLHVEEGPGVDVSSAETMMALL